MFKDAKNAKGSNLNKYNLALAETKLGNLTVANRLFEEITKNPNSDKDLKMVVTMA